MENDSTQFAIASLASKADDPDRALEDILVIIAQALNAESGSIALLNPDSGKLEPETSFGVPPDDNLSLAPGQGIPGWVAWHGKPALVPDTSADLRYRANRAEVRCQMAAPLLAPGGQALGVITLDHARVSGFTPNDLDRLARLADEASRVMQRLWELGHLQGKARQLETLLATGQSLVSKLEQQALFDTLTRDTRHLMQARACALYLYSEETGTVRVASFDGQAAVPPPEGDLPIDSCLIGAAIHTRRAVAFVDIQSPEFLDLIDLPRDPALHSVLTTPVVYEGDVLGVLAIFLDRAHRFDNDEKRLCLALANLGAVALQNVLLYARVFQSEESLRKNERLTTLGLLAAEIAHEIRNPLTVLKLLHGGLGADFSPDDPRCTDLRVINEKLDQLEAIVTRVLNFAKAPSSLHTRCSLVEIVEDTIVLIRLKLTQNKIHLEFNPPGRAFVVDGHKGQIQQVLLNLLINAMQAMPEGGKISIAVSDNGKGQSHPSAVIDITDTGAGIPEAIRDRIFDSFLSGRADGTGLGLAIAKRVLLSHNGDIALISSGPQGTTFRITLPLAKG